MVDIVFGWKTTNLRIFRVKGAVCKILCYLVGLGVVWGPELL